MLIAPFLHPFLPSFSFPQTLDLYGSAEWVTGESGEGDSPMPDASAPTSAPDAVAALPAGSEASWGAFGKVALFGAIAVAIGLCVRFSKRRQGYAPVKTSA